MKYLILFFSLFFLLFAHAQSSKKEFPRCEQVLSHVITSITHLPDYRHSLGLAKKKEGYFLVVQKYDYEEKKRKTLASIPVWDVETGEYIVPNLGEFKEEVADEKTISKRFYETWAMLERYDFALFYGYSERTVDEIEALESKEELSLREYEVLARAYSDQATCYLHQISFRTTPDFAKDHIPSNYEKIDQSRVDKSLEYFKKSQTYWKHIESVDPNYEPFIINNIHLKIANEQMHFWSQFVSVHEPNEAQKIIDQVDYAPIDIEVAKRLLDNCKPNAFLFTNGDSDTFPLWYVQEKLGYRPDVLVLNISLMQTDWFLSMCKARGGYNTYLSQEDYKNYKTLLVVPSEAGEVNIKTVFESHLSKLNGTIPKDGYIQVPGEIKVDLSGERTVILSDKRYFLLWELALLDIIVSNPERAFFAVSPRTTWDQIGLNNSWASRGSISQIVTGNDVVSSMDRASSKYIREQFNELDLTKICTSHMARYEFVNLLANLSELEKIYIEDYEEISTDVIDELDLEILKKSSDPELILFVLRLMDEVDPQKGIQLRKMYGKKAKEIIASLDDSGSNYLAMETKLARIYTIYSRRSFSKTLTTDSHENSEKDMEILKALEIKLKTIGSLLKPKDRLRTQKRVSSFLEKL